MIEGCRRRRTGHFIWIAQGRDQVDQAVDKVIVPADTRDIGERTAGTADGQEDWLLLSTTTLVSLGALGLIRSILRTKQEKDSQRTEASS